LPRPASSFATAAPRAYYAEGPDYVQMPPFQTFRDAESYAAVLGHETHWTKHGKRLARELGRVRHGRPSR
jgi:antirestriction protein ArdC